MKIHEHLRIGPAHFVVSGGIEAHEAAMLADAVRARIESGRPRVRIEFADPVAFVSSATIGALLMLQKLARAHGGDVVLVRPPRILRRSLRTLGIEDRFDAGGALAVA